LFKISFGLLVCLFLLTYLIEVITVDVFFTQVRHTTVKSTVCRHGSFPLCKRFSAPHYLISWM